jgi:hypothetical protein
MRKSLTLLLAGALLFQSAQAQQEKEKIKIKTGDPKPWTVKWNPGSLAFGKISLHSEYNYKKKKSITFGIGIPVESKFTDNNDGDQFSLSQKTFSVQGGYRMYFGKKDMRGFYFEPYLKYLNYKSTGTLTYKEVGINGANTYDLNINHSGFGIGAQLGVQFMIAKVLTFDLFLLGPEANIANTKGSFFDRNNNIPWTEVDRAQAEREIRDALKDLPLVGKQLSDNLTVNKEARTVSTNYSGFLPGFRIGGSIGVHF